MFLLKDMKVHRNINGDIIECPIQGCKKTVNKRKRGDKLRDKRFYCEDHKIFISPSTYEYKKVIDNLIYSDLSELEKLNKITEIKREDRLTRENSEDALSWNTFRYIERMGLLSKFISHYLKDKATNTRCMYWGVDEERGKIWQQLTDTSNLFNENKNSITEPDIILLNDDSLIFIEAKFTSKNQTTPSSKSEKYTTSDSMWFNKVFDTSFEQIAVELKMYQLMRLWLIGSHIARHNNLKFTLLNITLDKNEKNIESNFKAMLKDNKDLVFKRITWESIYLFIKSNVSKDEFETIENYYKGKTAGYKQGKIVKAFNLN